jgi:hypothetical protein
MSALDRWEQAYLTHRGPARVLAYRELMQAVLEAERAFGEADALADGQALTETLTEAEQRALDGNR